MELEDFKKEELRKNLQAEWFRDLLDEEIDDTKAAIDNEKMWELGYDGEEPNPHTENIVTRCEYLEMLEKLSELVDDFVNIEHYPFPQCDELISHAKNYNDKYLLAEAKSAARTYKCLCMDRHSGMSIQGTKTMLNRLIDGMPCKPIVIKDFYDTVGLSNDSDLIDYIKQNHDIQCKKYSALFMGLNKDGKFVYTDVNRFNVNYNYDNSLWSNGYVRDMGDKMFPIKLPYAPDSKSYVFHAITHNIKLGKHKTHGDGLENYVIYHYDYYTDPNSKQHKLHKYAIEKIHQVVYYESKPETLYYRMEMKDISGFEYFFRKVFKIRQNVRKLERKATMVPDIDMEECHAQ